MTGVRFNTGKLKWSLVHWKSLEPMVLVLMFGATKYTREEMKSLPEVEDILNNKIWESKQNVQNAKNTKVSLQKGCATDVTKAKHKKELNVSSVEMLEQSAVLKDIVNRAMKKNDYLVEQKSLQEEQSTKQNKSSEVKEDTLLSTVFPSNSIINCYNVVVGSVGQKKDHTLTMTIKQESLETCFVVSAIKLLDCYKTILILLELCTNTSATINEISNIKSGAHNWAKGLKVTEIVESLLRHTFALLEGEDDDKESKLPHVGHILCNAMFLSFMLMFRKDMDDRFKQETKDENPNQLKLKL